MFELTGFGQALFPVPLHRRQKTDQWHCKSDLYLGQMWVRPHCGMTWDSQLSNCHVLLTSWHYFFVFCKSLCWVDRLAFSFYWRRWVIRSWEPFFFDKRIVRSKCILWIIKQNYSLFSRFFLSSNVWNTYWFPWLRCVW